MGLRNGDKILAIDGEPVNSLTKVPVTIILDKASSIQVERDGQKVDVTVTEDDLSRIIKSKNTFISPRVPCLVDSVLPGRTAEKAGLVKGDKIVEVAGNKVTYFDEVATELGKNKGKVVTVKVDRNGEQKQLYIYVSTAGAVGFAQAPASKFLDFKKEEYGFFSSFPAGLNEGYEKIVMQVKQFAVIFTVKDAHQSIGGFYSLGQVYDPSWDWQVFWSFTAFLSVVLAFMNILPIPALDGGHIMFLLYEMVTRRKPNEKFMEYAQYAGMLLLLALMVYANTDFLRH